MKTNDELIKILKVLPKGTEIQCTHSTAAIYAVGENRVPIKVFDFWEGTGTSTDEMKPGQHLDLMPHGSIGFEVTKNLDFGDENFIIIGKPIDTLK